MSTARLVTLKVSVAVVSQLLILLTMAAVIWVFGPLFISNMMDLKSDALVLFAQLGQQTLASLTFWPALLLTQFTIAVILYASFSTWCVLRPLPIQRTALALLGYFVVLLIAALVFAAPGELGVIVKATLHQHLWLPVLLIPLATGYCVYSLLKNQVLTLRQWVVLAVFCGLATGFFIEALIAEGFYQPERATVTAAFVSMPGFLPLTAAVLALWTMTRVRHY